MKKLILSLIALFAVVGNSFALDKQSVKVKQSAQIPGGMYAEMTSPVLPVGKVNLKYDFIVDATDDEDAVIDCVIKFPLDFEIELLNISGIQGLTFEDGGVVPIIQFYSGDYNQYCEFLISQKSGGTASLEFQTTITEKYHGKNIPVTFNFTHYEKPFFNKWGTAIGIGVGIVAGVVVGVCTFNPGTGAAAGTTVGSAIGSAAATGICYCVAPVATTTGFGALGASAIGLAAGTVIGLGSNYGVNAVIKDSLQEIKNEYDAEQMHDSYTKFTIQVVR